MEGWLAPPPSVRRGDMLCGRPWNWPQPWLPGHRRSSGSPTNTLPKVVRAAVIAAGCDCTHACPDVSRSDCRFS
eukprot:6379644-Prymnesium_polylepis.1